jgi:RNA-directed DNA polymerase
MMHGGEKSDPAIVAGKPANKAEQSAAEPVEPRAGAKENAPEDGTSRTPSRIDVHSGLARVRQAAQGLKKQKFTALLHHVDAELLNSGDSALGGQRGVGGESPLR